MTLLSRFTYTLIYFIIRCSFQGGILQRWRFSAGLPSIQKVALCMPYLVAL